jgi:hypothetical protein
VNVPVHVGAVFAPPCTPLVPPWQYVAAQVSAVVLHDGVAPPVAASVPNTTAAVPVACVLSPAGGTAWHSLQAIGFARKVFWLRCAACAPTARAVVAVSPCEPIGGAAGAIASAPAIATRVASPWHSAHPPAAVAEWAATSVTTPSTCVLATTVVVE